MSRPRENPDPQAKTVTKDNQDSTHATVNKRIGEDRTKSQVQIPEAQVKRKDLAKTDRSRPNSFAKITRSYEVHQRRESIDSTATTRPNTPEPQEEANDATQHNPSHKKGKG